MTGDKNSRLVYSTEAPLFCERCGKKRNKCKCEKKTVATPKGDGIVRISRVTKGRKGKGVTLITGIDKPENDLKILAKRLKQKCGTGGTLKNGTIEIQGDHRTVLKEELEQEGFTVKLSGG